MAQDLRSLNVYPAFKTFTIADNACTEIQLPSAANQVSIGCEGTKIYMAQNGYTEGDDIDTDDNAFIPASNFLIIKLGKGKNRASSIFVQSSSGNVKCHVILEEV
jgi:hypothetical protein